MTVQPRTRNTTARPRLLGMPAGRSRRGAWMIRRRDEGRFQWPVSKLERKPAWQPLKVRELYSDKSSKSLLLPRSVLLQF